MSTLTAKDFQNPLLRVLGQLTGCKAGQPVKGEDTYGPVMAIMNITDINDLGDEPSSGQPLVARLIQWANKNLRKTGHTSLEGRGQWVLTDKGVQEIQSMTQGLATTSTPVVAAPVVVAPAPVVVAPAPIVRSPYLDDPYILERVLSSTGCLGHYTPHKGAECFGCPVTAECRNTLYARMTKAALKLAEEDAKARPVATPAAAPAPAAPAPAATPAGTRKGSLNTSEARKVKTFEDAVCTECGKTINKGSHMVWVDDIDTGEIRVLHVSCFEALR